MAFYTFERTLSTPRLASTAARFVPRTARARTLAYVCILNILGKEYSTRGNRDLPVIDGAPLKAKRKCATTDIHYTLYTI